MKRIITLSFMLLCFNAFSQNGPVKTTTGTADNFHYKDGKVGIGTNNPASQFDINGEKGVMNKIHVSNATVGTEGGYFDINIGNGNAYAAGMKAYVPSGQPGIDRVYLGLYTTTYNDGLKSRLERLTITDRGNVGIGTSSPNAKLHVNNGDNSYGVILAQADESSFQLYAKTITTQPANIESFRLGLKHSTNESNGFISFYRGGSSVGGFLGFSTYGQERIRIASGGNVGIGTTNPNYKLDVLGTIRARELKVDMQGADFVFEENYPLRPISELEDFVKANKHLPEIAPAKEMQKNGVNQSEMNQKLLQKIEELTLYMIEQNKLIKSQGEEIKELKRNRK